MREHRRNARWSGDSSRSRRGWGRRAASPSCASTAATTSTRFSQQAMRELRDVHARLRGRSRDLGGDPDRLGQGLLGRLRPQGSRRPPARHPAGRRAHPAPAARPQDVQGLAGHGPGHDRRHRGPLHRRRRGAGRVARLPLLRQGRAFPHSRGRARHEHELGLDPAHAGADGPGAHQAGGDPGIGSHPVPPTRWTGAWSRRSSRMARRSPPPMAFAERIAPPAADSRCA